MLVPQFNDRLIEIKSKRKKTSRSAPSQQSPLNKTSLTLEYSSMQEILNISHSIDKIESPIGRDRAGMYLKITHYKRIVFFSLDFFQASQKYNIFLFG